MPTLDSDRATPPIAAPRTRLSISLQDFLTRTLAEVPHRIAVVDWGGAEYDVGGDAEHWSGDHLRVHIKEESAGRLLLKLDVMGFLERFLAGEVDLEGNLYLLPTIRASSSARLNPLRVASNAFRAIAFQNQRRASVNVRSHYDIPQTALNVYLDRRYMSYSCGMWEDPDDLDLEDVRRIGTGEDDDFDSLEKAQWRKFADAADYVAPGPGDSVLDVGCGYGGQLDVALERHDFAKVVGWTHSHNQAVEGARMLARHDPDRWELHEGDYRQDDRVFDHITSTGMISHVGPRGLVPYVQEIRKRIKTGGRYLHHSLMTSWSRLPIDFNVGIAFNKKYVWPGFHWFSLGDHVKALEENGFQVEGVRNLTRHYAKTTTAWYERMMDRRTTMVENLGEPTLRAWQVFLAGITGSFLSRNVHVYRLYCVAT